jgi:hypothetical protein
MQSAGDNFLVADSATSGATFSNHNIIDCHHGMKAKGNEQETGGKPN